MNFNEGEILYIDKPYRMSSFGALARVRHLISQKLGVKRVKIGHAGTLDPLATGVMILCTGRATKRIEEFQYHTSQITRELIEEKLKNFLGSIQQVPPAYSACKINGDRAYDLARQGKNVELKAKTLVIDEIELTDFNQEKMQMSIRVVCSKGTYIRALARDIGAALDSGAYLTALRRTRVGKITESDCITLDDFPEWLNKQEIDININKGDN